MTKLFAGVLLLALGCGGAADGHNADAPEVVTAPTTCDLRHSRSSAELLVAADALLTHMNEKGATAFVDHPDVGSVSYWHVHVDLPVAVDRDPRPAILAFLASVRETPVHPDEYAPSPERPATFPASGFVAGFVRTRIGATKLGDVPLEALTASVQANGPVWRISSLTITPAILFASEADAKVHARCAPPATPPDAAIRALTFRGLELEHCAEVGSYEYSPRADDPIQWRGAPWGDGVLWTVGERGGALEWVPQRGARLSIAKPNYWDRIGYADCYCHDEKSTGFTLIVHALTGAVLRYTPAINCVVC